MKNNRQYIEKILEVQRTLFPYLTGISFLLLGIESYKYSGFLEKYIYVGSSFFLAAGGVLALTYILTWDGYKKSVIFRLNKFLFPVIFTFYLVMEFLENKFYPNYVFSHIHLQPQNFVYLVYFSGLLLIIGGLKYRLRISKEFKAVHYLGIGLILISLLYSLFNGSFTIVNQAINSDVFVLTHLNYGYDEKMEQWWGFYYAYMKFVQIRTNASSSIFLPPQELSSSAGNMGLDRYFLYPRTLIDGVSDTPIDINKYDYVMVVRGDNGIIWPKIKISADNISFINSKTLITSEIYINYDPAKVPDNSWGLIKIKK